MFLGKGHGPLRFGGCGGSRVGGSLERGGRNHLPREGSRTAKARELVLVLQNGLSRLGPGREKDVRECLYLGQGRGGSDCRDVTLQTVSSHQRLGPGIAPTRIDRGGELGKASTLRGVSS